MSSKSNDQGRAYEYACLHILNEAIKSIRPSRIIINSSYKAARVAWQTLSISEMNLYRLSARSTIETIFALEPNIIEPGTDLLNLYIQSDKNGENADVRDIIIERKDIVWEIGLSIKHNHKAVKHSRLSKHLDFGKKWYGKDCSQSYWESVNPIFDFLENEKDKGTYFRDLNSKVNDVYIPILKAFMAEVKMQVENDDSIPRKLVEYLLSKFDFYKIISIDKIHVTTIQSFNMFGTLNLPSRISQPSIKIPILELPTTLLFVGFKPRSKTTVLMCFDNGWQFSFRIHNAKDTVEPSLKFDVKIDGMPSDVNVKFNCKW